MLVLFDLDLVALPTDTIYIKIFVSFDLDVVALATDTI